MSLDNTYVIGLDFGTLSVRAAVVRVSDGHLMSEAVREYETPIMDRTLTAGDNRELPPDFALQVPGDYVRALEGVVPEAVKNSGIDVSLLKGIAVDTTSATVIFTDENGRGMNEDPRFVNEPHAYMKLWKHHGAQKQVERIIELAKERGESWLARYGGTLSSEMLLPKALETLENAPDLFQATTHIVDLTDWITWMLTGTLTYSASSSGYKRMYQDGTYPSKDYLGALNPDFANVYEEKMNAPILPLGANIGGLTDTWAQKFGIPSGIAVATGNIDAHVHCVAVGATEPGQLTGILGTSTCWLLPSVTGDEVPGVFGVVDGGIVDGCWGYEAGQSAVGDSFAWFVDNCVPPAYHEEAAKRGLNIHQYLQELAQQQKVGEHGLVALDWWNGNRSILVDANLSGLMIGQTLTTTPEDQYRALLESTAFGARVIIENYEKHGVPIREIRVAGGLLKSTFLMQMYADITRRPLYTATTLQAGALGSAIFASVAAGLYPDIRTAAEAMGGVSETIYYPREAEADAYDELFVHYEKLYDLFGCESHMMSDLKRIRSNARR